MDYDVLDNTSRGMTGEFGQLNVYDPVLKKYVLLLPLETLPSVVGSVNTIENDVTTSRTIGKIKGKMTIDDKDVEFLWCRDNIERLNGLIGKKHQFLISYKDGTGWKFSGEITYRNNDAQSSDKLTGTLTIIASSVDDVATSNALDLMAKTCVITNDDIPAEVHIAKTSGTITFPVQFSNSTANCTAECDNEQITAQYSEGNVTISTSFGSPTNGVVTLTPKASGEASWKTYILVIVE